MNWSEWVILAVLGLFSIRDILAAFGNIPRNNKWYSKLIYGNHDENLMAKILSDWGFADQTAKDIKKSIKKVAIESQKESVKNYFEKLVFLLAKYTMHFPDNVNYSEDINSKFYVDTMEASTNSTSLMEMTALMVNLIIKSIASDPDVIVVPKGGNVELAQSVAMKFSAKLVVVKDKCDDSRATSIDSSSKDCHKVNIEGSWELFEQNKKQAILIDCNTSKGTQLINVVKEFNSAVDCGMKVNKITDVFVLYRVDNGNTQIEEIFKDEGCTLHRYFDLNEDYKKLLYDLNPICVQKNTTIYDKKIKGEIESIIEHLRENNMLVFQEDTTT